MRTHRAMPMHNNRGQHMPCAPPNGSHNREPHATMAANLYNNTHVAHVWTHLYFAWGRCD